MRILLTYFAMLCSCVFIFACDSKVEVAPQGPALENANVAVETQRLSNASFTRNNTPDALVARHGTDSQVDDGIEEIAEHSTLSSDPTEDPDQERGFYEFPAWNVPAPPK